MINSLEMFSHRSSISDRRTQICPSSGADVSADGEGYDNDMDVTENKRRKSKIELDRFILLKSEPVL